jgi:hypothetical protein
LADRHDRPRDDGQRGRSDQPLQLLALDAARAPIADRYRCDGAHEEGDAEHIGQLENIEQRFDTGHAERVLEGRVGDQAGPKPLPYGKRDDRPDQYCHQPPPARREQPAVRVDQWDPDDHDQDRHDEEVAVDPGGDGRAGQRSVEADPTPFRVHEPQELHAQDDRRHQEQPAN